MANERELGEALREVLIGMKILPETVTAGHAEDLLRTAAPRKTPVSSLSNPNLRLLAQRVSDVLVENHPVDVVKSMREQIGSRKLGVYVQMELPALGNKTLIFDTRVDNGAFCPQSLRDLTSGTAGSPWPAPEAIPPLDPGGDVQVLGCPGSSCPQIGHRAALNGSWDTAQVPVDIIAFHAEGHNGEVAYSIRMFADVSGRLDIPLNPSAFNLQRPQSIGLNLPPGPAGVLDLGGQMVVTIVPDRPEDFGGMERIEVVSQGIVRQKGRVSQWPPGLGDYLQTVGSESYALLSDREQPVAVVKIGRIIFSDEEDPFLQARTRVHTFIFTDDQGNALSASDPVENIRGVRLFWEDVRNAANRVTHYRVYKATPRDRSSIRSIGEEIYVPQFLDPDFDGRHTAYAVVPCTRNVLGEEVIGIGLDAVELSYIRPDYRWPAETEQVSGHLGFR